MRVISKSVLLIYGLFCALVVTAQDFTSLFLKEQPADSTLVHITIGPKMMEDILQVETGMDAELFEMITNLKSMQMLSSGKDSDNYYAVALEVLGKYPKRFQSYLSFEEGSKRYCLMVRKQKKAIVELVLLVNKNSQFTVINFTGNIDERFIEKLTGSINKEEIPT